MPQIGTIIAQDRVEIPESLLGAIERYVTLRIPPGGFLTAVLSNDLRDALGRADETSRAALFEIVRYLYNCAPGECWGSRDAVRSWLSR